ncbi:MAG: DUF4037 domain-containing protein [Promethearchaeota archaeon]
MKGLDIGRDFFLDWGLSFLKKEFPELTLRISAGRFLGSDVIGADDKISRDHDWGPQFTLFLSEDDFCNLGNQLSERINRGAPINWKGYRLEGADSYKKSVFIESVPRWIKKHYSFSKLPRSDEDWGLKVREGQFVVIQEDRESPLYFLKHGVLWLSNNDELNQWRKALEYYPKNVWYGRLSQECFNIWHYGEYNFVQRISKRGDPITLHLCLGEFVKGVMRIQFLLKKDYTPYWKWLAYEFRKLDCAQHYIPLLESLLRSDNIDKKIEIVKLICHDIHQQILSTRLISGKGAKEYAKYLLPLLNDHDEFLQLILNSKNRIRR